MLCSLILRVRRHHLAALLLGGAGLALRGRALPPAVSDLDGVHFARALERFDPLQQAPHFPGYPVYVAATRAAAVLVDSELLALTLPSLLLLPVALLVLAAGGRRHLPGPALWGALLFAALAPGPVLAGAWPTSDGFGFALALLVLGVLGRAVPRAGEVPAVWAGGALGLTAALLLGARLSYWPIVLVAVVAALQAGAARRAVLIGGVVGLAVWGAPLALSCGPALWDLGLSFAAGHFTRWGGGALAASAGPGARLQAAHAALGLGAAGDTPIAAILLAGLLALAVLGLREPRGRALLLALLGTYAAWLLLGQDVHKLRHVLPLLPVLGALAFTGAARLTRAGLPLQAGLGLAVAVLGFISSPVQADSPAPALALARFVAARPPERLAVFTGDEARLIEHTSRAHRVLRAQDPLAVAREARRLHALGVEVWLTSATAVPPALRPELTTLAEFAAPRGMAEPSRLELYRLGPPRPGLAAREVGRE